MFGSVLPRVTLPSPPDRYDPADQRQLRALIETALARVPASDTSRGQVKTFVVTDAPYNARGDGLHDETVAIQACITACAGVGGGVVRIPGGTYLVTRTFSCPSYVRVVGDGAATIINFQGAGQYVFDFENASYAGVEDLLLKGVFGWGVRFYKGAFLHVRRCDISGGTTPSPTGYFGAVVGDGSTDVWVEDNYCHDNGDASNVANADIMFGGFSQSQSRVRIERNRCESTAVHFNIFCFDPIHFKVNFNTVSGALNNAGNNSGYGIMFYRTIAFPLGTTNYENEAVGNDVSNTQGTGIYNKEGYRNYIGANTGNNVAQTQDDVTLNVAGIALNASPDCFVIGNVIKTSGKTGCSATTGSDRTKFIGNHAEDCAKSGFEPRGVSDALYFEDDTAKNCLGGVGWPSSAACTNLKVKNCTIIGGQGTTSAISANGWIGASIEGNDIDTPPGIGIQLIGAKRCGVNLNKIKATAFEAIKDGNSGDHNSYIGNKMADGGTAAAATFPAMNLQSPSALVGLNEIDNTLGPTNGWTIGINFSSAAANSLHGLNRVKGVTTSAGIAVAAGVGIIGGSNLTTLSGNFYELASVVALPGDPTGGPQVIFGTKAGKNWGSVGTRFSGGDEYSAFNAYQDTFGADSWTQPNSALKSTLWLLKSDGSVDFYTAAAGTGPGTFAAFWTITWACDATGIVRTAAATNSTGAGAALLGANSPAITLAAPYTWVKELAADGSTCYRPLWK